jgi:hypothetical protein
MPDFGNVIKTDDDLWKIIAWIRSVYCGRGVGNATARNSALLWDANRENFYMASKSA